MTHPHDNIRVGAITFVSLGNSDLCRSLVKPSLDFNADVAITSPTIAITRKSQPFMIFESLLVTLSGTVPDIDVESITVIGEGEGSATQIASLLEKLKQTTGIDLAKSLPGQSDSPAAKS